MNNFREFQKQYNDYLQHGLPYADDYICHFGILGMKWGVRRYQNPDGTLTDAGKKRYDKLVDKANKLVDKADSQTTVDHQKYYNDKAAALYKKAEKYGLYTREERIEKMQKEYDQKKTIAEKYGFKGDDDMDGDFVNDKKDIVIDKDTPLNEKFMKQVDNFNKNYKDHDKIMRQAATKQMAERFGVSESEMKKIIDKNDRPWIYMTDNTNGDISMSADYDLFDGNHVATVEYDPKTKKVYYVSMNG